MTVAARLRYPTAMDAELVGLAGPGGSGALDRITGAEDHEGEPWRTWVDEVVASWAACLLSDAGLAARAVAALGGGTGEYRRLLAPTPRTSGRRPCSATRTSSPRSPTSTTPPSCPAWTRTQPSRPDGPFQRRRAAPRFGLENPGPR